MKKYYLKRNGRAPAGRSEKIFEKPGDLKSVGTADYRLKTADYRLQTANCRPQTEDCRQQTADCGLKTAD